MRNLNPYIEVKVIYMQNNLILSSLLLLTDTLDIGFICLMMILLSIVYFSTRYDKKLKQVYEKATGMHVEQVDHYKTLPVTACECILPASKL